MSRFIDNVNAYLSQMKIKQKYVSMKSDIDEKKLSRILNEVQKVDIDDMERISKALGYKVEYFLSEDFNVLSYNDIFSTEVAFYAGEPTEEQQKFAMKLIDMVENIDEVLSVKHRYMNAFME